MLAVLVLAMAFIPISGLITSDTVSTVAVARETHAQHLARMIMDSLLDEVKFDDLSQGSPAIMTGESLDDVHPRLFPGGTGGICQGEFTGADGTIYHVQLQVREQADDGTDNSLGFSYFESPNFIASWTKSLPNAQNHSQSAKETENDGNPSYYEGTDTVYTHPNWAATERTLYKRDFTEDTNPCFMKTLVLRIRWSNADRLSPLSSDRPGVLWLVAHKANLRTLP